MQASRAIRTSLPAHTTPANLHNVVQAVRTLKAVLKANWPVNGWTPEALSSLKSEFSGNRSRLWELIVHMQRETPALPSPSTAAVATAVKEEDATSGSTAAVPAAPATSEASSGAATLAAAAAAGTQGLPLVKRAGPPNSQDATTPRRLGAGGGQQQLQTMTIPLLAQLGACRSRVAGAAAVDLALAAMPRAPGEQAVVYMPPALQAAAAAAAADAAAGADTDGEVLPGLGDLLPLLSAGGEAADAWLLLSDVYAARFPGLRATELLRLFKQLGVMTFPEPTARLVKLTAAELQAIPWAADDAAAGMSAQAPPQPSCKPKQPSEAVDAPVEVLDWSCLALLRLVLQAMGTPTTEADVVIPRLRLLAQLLAAHWDRFEAAMDARLLLEPLAPPLSSRRPQGPSSIAFELRELPWLVARLGGELCLRRPVEVFAPLRAITQVLGH
ncbi:hypothetical protein PLESTF_001830800 [Pleodorina starrii]|nr:hypothetical protein PLESTF_001830800 [Pleodorina starrii]